MQNKLERVTFNVTENGIAKIELNRAEKLNALDMAMFKALDQVIKRIKRNRTIRVVIVSGRGDDFCTGLDTKSVLTNPFNGINLLRKLLPGNANLAQRVSVRWRALSVPVIACIHGRCWGGGMQIALGADFRIAHKDASLSIMESKWGLIPDMGGNKPLSQLMSIDQAMKLAMTGEVITSTQAFDLGLVTQNVDDPMGASLEMAENLINTSPDVLSSIKHMYYRNWHRPQRAMLGMESWLQSRILMSPNQKIATSRAKGTDKPYINRKVK